MNRTSAEILDGKVVILLVPGKLTSQLVRGHNARRGYKMKDSKSLFLLLNISSLHVAFLELS